MTTAQLCLMRSLKKNGFPNEFLGLFISRCGAGAEEWELMVEEGWIEEVKGRFQLTELGKRIYKRESKGRYF